MSFAFKTGEKVRVVPDGDDPRATENAGREMTVVRTRVSPFGSNLVMVRTEDGNHIIFMERNLRSAAANSSHGMTQQEGLD